MIYRIFAGTTGTPFSRSQRAALRSLRATFESAQHLLTERELARLIQKRSADGVRRWWDWFNDQSAAR